MLDKVLDIAKKASSAIMDVYAEQEVGVKTKGDNSPLTMADINSHHIIKAGLETISDIPVLSEEDVVPYARRKDWTQLWLVDPLDGTKDFLARNGMFTVNIALVKDYSPVLGVIAIPATGEMYWAEAGKGAYRNGERIYNRSERTQLIGSDSNFHSTQETMDFYGQHGVEEIQRYGSALKFCKLAEGEIDLYARLNGTMEWDTAAGQVIMQEAGCKIIDVVTGQPIVYNREELRNNHFIASRVDLDFV